MFKCWRDNDHEDYTLVDAYDFEAAAEKYIGELAGCDNYEYYEEDNSVEVTVEDDEGNQKAFDVLTQTSVSWRAEETL